MLKREILFENNFVQITRSGWLAGQLTSHCMISNFPSTDVWFVNHYSLFDVHIYILCFFSLFHFWGTLLCCWWAWVTGWESQTGFCELPRAGFAHLLVASDYLVWQLTMWAQDLYQIWILVLLNLNNKIQYYDAHKDNGVFGTPASDLRASVVFSTTGREILSWKTLQRYIFIINEKSSLN